MLSAQLCDIMKAALPQISFTDQLLSEFSMLYDRIVETNAAINITSILEENSVVMKHFIDSLSLFQAEEFTKLLPDSPSICDIGCGGGFPGLPLALVLRGKKLVMIDSTEKRSVL